MSLEERPFEIADVKSLLGNTTENIKNNISIKMLKMMKFSGESRSWWNGEVLIGCGGIVMYDKGKCEAWSAINKDLIKKLKREIFVLAKRFINEMAEKHRIKYMRATWRYDFDPKIKWLEHLGFKKEDGIITLENGNVSYIYSRSFKWD